MTTNILTKWAFNKFAKLYQEGFQTLHTSTDKIFIFTWFSDGWSCRSHVQSVCSGGRSWTWGSYSGQCHIWSAATKKSQSGTKTTGECLFFIRIVPLFWFLCSLFFCFCSFSIWGSFRGVASTLLMPAVFCLTGQLNTQGGKHMIYFPIFWFKECLQDTSHTAVMQPDSEVLEETVSRNCLKLSYNAAMLHLKSIWCWKKCNTWGKSWN